MKTMNIFVIALLLLAASVSSQPWAKAESRGSLTAVFDVPTDATADKAQLVSATNCYRVWMGKLPPFAIVTELPIIYVITAWNGTVSDSLCVGTGDDLDWLTAPEALAASTGLLTADWNSTNYAYNVANGTGRDLFLYYVAAAATKATTGKAVVSVQYSIAKP